MNALNITATPFLHRGQTKESYDVLYECVTRNASRLATTPTRINYMSFINISIYLSQHPHIQDDYDLQLQILSTVLSWLKTGLTERDEEGDNLLEDVRYEIASIEREVLWDYANVHAAAGHLQKSEDALTELVHCWRVAYESEWDVEEGRPESVGKWYYTVLDMYAKVLDVGGKASESRKSREMADSLLSGLKHTFWAKFRRADKIGRIEWRPRYDLEDMECPPQLICTATWVGRARPAALLRTVEDQIQSSSNTLP